MSSRRREKRRKVLANVGLGVLAAATLAIVLGVTLTPRGEAPAVSAKVAAAYATGTALPTTTAPKIIPPKPLTYGPGSKVLIIGDSWTSGTGGSAPTNGYAYQLGKSEGFVMDVQGMGSTGYLNPGTSGDNTYINRINAMAPSTPDMVILQGSVNDQNKERQGMEEVFLGTIEALKAKYPAAQVVVFGPVPSTYPTNPNLINIDQVLKNMSQVASVQYITPLQEAWLKHDNYGALMNAENRHPNDAGHTFLAVRLAESLAALKAP